MRISSKNLKSSPERWGTVSIVLHWLTAILILIIIPVGIVADGWRLSPMKIDLFILHKSLGVLILVLVVFRITWRLFDARPDFPENTTPTQYRLAISTHLSLYVLLIGLPVSGWIINDSGDFPFRWFWLFPMPDLLPKNVDLKEIASTLHAIFIYLLATILVVHIAAALRHHFFLKDNVLRNMLGRNRMNTKPTP
jgi:cytochrome b561